MQHWYVVHTKPNSERIAEDALQVRFGIQTYLPTYRDRRDGPEKPFLPCYLFARLDLGQAPLGELSWTHGIRRLVSFGGEPMPVDEEAVEYIRRRLEAVPGQVLTPAQRLKPGDRVRITQGPLADLEGLFHATGPQERVTVLLGFLSRGTKASLPAQWVEKVGDGRTRRRLPRRTRGKGRRIRGRD